MMESRMGQPIRPGERWDDSPEPRCECGAKSCDECHNCCAELCEDCAMQYGRIVLCAKCLPKFVDSDGHIDDCPAWCGEPCNCHVRLEEL